MAEEKMACHGCHGCKIFKSLGLIAIVYGVIEYLTTVIKWQSYAAWIVGGIILLLIGWAKKSMDK